MFLETKAAGLSHFIGAGGYERSIAARSLSRRRTTARRRVRSLQRCRNTGCVAQRLSDAKDGFVHLRKLPFRTKHLLQCQMTRASAKSAPRLRHALGTVQIVRDIREMVPAADAGEVESHHSMSTTTSCGPKRARRPSLNLDAGRVSAWSIVVVVRSAVPPSVTTSQHRLTWATLLIVVSAKWCLPSRPVGCVLR